MTPSERAQAVTALRAAAAVLTASKLAFPKKLRDQIARQVRTWYLEWMAWEVGKRLRKAQREVKKGQKQGVDTSKVDKSLADLTQAQEWIDRLGRGIKVPKASTAAAKLKTREAVFDIDLDDMPAGYQKALERSTVQYGEELKVEFNLDKRHTKWAGKYGPRTSRSPTRKLLIYAPPYWTPDATKFKRSFQDIVEIIEHELRHMVQDIMKGVVGPKAGTPYGPGERVSREVDPMDPYAYVGREEVAEDEAFPKATRQERYYLRGIEFYPNLETAAHHWLQDAKKGGPKKTREEFRAWVGLAQTHRAAPFFRALKKHDPKRWRKAVSEAWTRAAPFVTE